MRRLGSALLVLTLAAVLTGCGSSGPTILSASQAEASLIAASDLGSGFKVDTSKNSSSSTDMGCLNNLDKFGKKKLKPARDKTVQYKADSPIGIPLVFSAVASLNSVSDATKGVHEFSSLVAHCTTVDTTDSNGFHIKLNVSSNTTKIGSAATAQINLIASGTGQTQGITVPFSFDISLIQLKNQVAMVGYVTMATDISTDANALAKIALDRLVAATDGKPAPKPKPLNLHIVTQAEILGGANA